MSISDSTLVVIRTYLNEFEAEIAQSALEAAGIESMIQSDDCGGMRPHLWMGGVEILVRSEDAANASEVLDSTAIDAPEEATETPDDSV